MLLLLAITLIRVQPASGEVPDASVEARIALVKEDPEDAQVALAQGYARDFDVSLDEAKRRIREQALGGDIVRALAHELGTDFAGVWYDNEAGEFVVPLAAQGLDAKVRDEFDIRELSASYRVEYVDSTWEQLTKGQAEIDKALGDLFEKSLVQTGLDPRANTILIGMASSISAKDREQISAAAKSVGPRVEIVERKPEDIAPPVAVCAFPNCDKPLRGGVYLYPSGCTIGFLVYGNVNNQRYMMTAGHCFNWQAGGTDATTVAFDGSGTYRGIGGVWNWMYGTTGDAGIVRVLGTSWWNMNPGDFWPGVVVWPGQAPQQNFHTIYNGAQSSYKGLYTCHSGASSQAGNPTPHPSTTCGEVSDIMVTTPFDTDKDGLGDGDGDGIGDTTVGNLTHVTGPSLCSWPGDSGGPFYANYTAYGIHNAALGGCNNGGLYYTEALAAASNLGVHFKNGPPWP